jgi:hypothetical protein
VSDGPLIEAGERAAQYGSGNGEGCEMGGIGSGNSALEAIGQLVGGTVM